MRKSIVIARCLVNSNMIGRLEDAEAAVQRMFNDEFPTERLSDWNTEMDEQSAERIISNVGRASRINVRRFIDDLRQFPPCG